MEDCLFCKIIKGEIPSAKVYEDDDIFAFLDIAPMKKGHTLVVPKNHSKTLVEADDEDLKKVFAVVKKLAPAIMKAVDAQGFNVEINNARAAGQLIDHTHIHIIPRHEDDGLKHWPQGKYEEGESDKLKEKIGTFLNE